MIQFMYIIYKYYLLYVTWYGNTNIVKIIINVKGLEYS